MNDVRELEGCEKVKTERSSLVVYGRGGEVLWRVGPEERPFVELGMTEWKAVAEIVAAAVLERE